MLSKAANRYWEQNLVCPKCRGQIKVVDSSMKCQSCHSLYPIIEGVPCFVPNVLDEHQKAELESTFGKSIIQHHNKLAEQGTIPIIEKPLDVKTPAWLEGKLDSATVTYDSRIICIGGANGDDLPHIKSQFKFNVDHLAHEYIKLSSEMTRQQATEGAIKHIASTSENLPFSNSYADVVFSKNSLDHVNNPLKTMLEVH